MCVLLEARRAAESLRALLAKHPLLCVLLGHWEKPKVRRNQVDELGAVERWEAVAEEAWMDWDELVTVEMWEAVAEEAGMNWEQ